MKKLLKIYSFNSDMQYFEMIVESFHNGNKTQAFEQFSAMPKSYRILFLKNATIGGWESALSRTTLGFLFDKI